MRQAPPQRGRRDGALDDRVIYLAQLPLICKPESSAMRALALKQHGGIGSLALLDSRRRPSPPPTRSSSGSARRPSITSISSSPMGSRGSRSPFPTSSEPTGPGWSRQSAPGSPRCASATGSPSTPASPAENARCAAPARNPSAGSYQILGEHRAGTAAELHGCSRTERLRKSPTRCPGTPPPPSRSRP